MVKLKFGILIEVIDWIKKFLVIILYYNNYL